MTDFRFAEPQFVHLLWLVLAALALLIWLDRRGGDALARFVSLSMQPRLVARPTSLRRGLRLGLLGLSAVFMVVALMRPQWGGELVTSQRVGAEIMICLDVSRSMLAEDVAPNRLERSKAEIRDLLGFLDGNQVGLIAFAGRASVVAPLTPDFGFLRLVLDTLDSSIVGRGGTRLEEPIRKAVAGFGEAGDLARVILLITDGEDHDSFPLDAAREARERGIRILAVGFGDEGGSEVQITDPRTGARSALRDADGRPVISRLDGELLRELALETEGAYIPAGTGLLDLESIFDAHIEPLMRSSQESRKVRTVRNEGYQWAVLAGLGFLVASLLGFGPRQKDRRGPGSHAALLALLLSVATAPNARAQAPTSTPPPAPSLPSLQSAATAEADGEEAEAFRRADDVSGRAREELDIGEDPRKAYNSGLDALHGGQLDDASRLLEATRNLAGVDGEARFRATYNLGWVEIERAELALETDPESALASLERAADWFRTAIGLRPKHEDSRRNLEIVLRRITALADSLAAQNPQELNERLEALITAQREALPGLRALVETAALLENPHAIESMRHDFRRAEVVERTLLGTAQSVSGLAADELTTLEGTSDGDRTPEDRIRIAQLTGLHHYLHRARERMGQARSQLRQRQAERAYRRAAAALSSLKRARDQLLDPVQVLDAILAEADQVARETQALAAMTGGLALGEHGQTAKAPAWLSARALGEAQAELVQRTGELDARLRAGLESGEAADPSQQALLQQIAEAQPLIAAGERHFESAQEELEANRVFPAVTPQAEGIEALADARERFLDLKRLIELAYADQRRIGAIIHPEDDPERGVSAADLVAQLPEFAGTLSEAQVRNVSRAIRMRPMLDQMLVDIDAPKPEEEGQDPESVAKARAQQRQQLEVATEILALTESAMTSASEHLGALADSDSELASARQSSKQAVSGLENLRRLFFSILEHLRDVARRQTELGDDTAEAGTASEVEALRESLERLSGEQSRLSKTTDELAMALHEQSFEDPAAGPGGNPELSAEEAQEISERFVRASELVLAAQEAMATAGEGMVDAEPELAGIREDQSLAVEKLLEAIATLQPPQQEPDPSQQDSGDSEQQPEPESQSGDPEQQQAQAGASPETPDDEAQERASDPSQLLQQVRDREAQRHRDRAERGARQTDPVEKDW